MLDRDPRKWNMSNIRLTARENGVQHQQSSDGKKLWYAAVMGLEVVLLADYASERSLLLAALREVAKRRPALLSEYEEEDRIATGQAQGEGVQSNG